jgi:hypothetical protein
MLNAITLRSPYPLQRMSIRWAKTSSIGVWSITRAGMRLDESPRETKTCGEAGDVNPCHHVKIIMDRRMGQSTASAPVHDLLCVKQLSKNNRAELAMHCEGGRMKRGLHGFNFQGINCFFFFWLLKR